MFVLWILDVVNDNAYEKDKTGKRIIGDNGRPICKVVKKDDKN